MPEIRIKIDAETSRSPEYRGVLQDDVWYALEPVRRIKVCSVEIEWEEER